MNFKCGVIVIGALLWDDLRGRDEWRKKAFVKSDNGIPVNLPIRYGRISETWNDSFTMIYSNHKSTRLGKGRILTCKRPVKSFKGLLREAVELAKAEGIYKVRNPSIVSTWGAIGLLINPKLLKSDSGELTTVLEHWARHFSKWDSTAFAENAWSKKESPIITAGGRLNISWTRQMNEFDLLLSTQTQPNVMRPPTPMQIAKAIIEAGKDEYFTNNKNNGIQTFQDTEIARCLKKCGC